MFAFLFVFVFVLVFANLRLRLRFFFIFVFVFVSAESNVDFGWHDLYVGAIRDFPVIMLHETLEDKPLLDRKVGLIVAL